MYRIVVFNITDIKDLHWSLSDFKSVFLFSFSFHWATRRMTKPSEQKFKLDKQGFQNKQGFF